MTSYIILLCLMAVVGFAIFRATQQQPRRRHRYQEPRLGSGNSNTMAASSREAIEIKSAEEKASLPHPIQTTIALADPVEPELNTENTHQVCTDIILTKEVEAGGSIDTEEWTPVESNNESSIFSSPFSTDLIVFSVLANPTRPYRGYELLQTLLTAGFRYGKHSIFHRYEKITGQGSVLFSLASAVEPGTFDLAKIGSFTTKGLTLFLQVSSLKDPLTGFNMMFSTAQELIEGLGGYIVDDTRQPLSPEKIAQWQAMLKNIVAATSV